MVKLCNKYVINLCLSAIKCIDQAIVASRFINEVYFANSK